MDAITLLREDHRAVEKLFKEFEKAGPRAGKTKAKLVKQITRELAIHAVIEEQVFYPAVRESVEDADDLVLESLEEHHIVKWVLSELENLTPEDERYDAKVTVLMENVRHHVEEEEKEMFPAVRKALSRKDLDELGDLLARAKKVAPTHPHPKAPDEPPGNAVAGLVSGLIDRVRDTAKGAAANGSRAVASTARRTSRTASRRTSGP